MSKAEDRIAAARLRLCRRWPYMSTAVLSMVEIESPDVPTMCVDAKWRLYWNRGFVDELSNSDLEFVVAHEVSHLVLGHHKRADRVLHKEPGKRAKLWNIAADYAVNTMLSAEGMKPPEDAMMPAMSGYPDELPVEDYFQRLMGDQRDEEQDSDQGDGDGGSDPGHGSGSGSDGIPREWEQDIADSPLSEGENGGDSGGGGAEGGDHGDSAAAGVDSHDSEAIRDKVIESLRKSRSGHSAGLQRLVNENAPAKVNPKALLRRAVHARLRGSESGPGTASYRRPARRPAIGGALRPRCVKPSPNVTIIVDTSGSMSSSEIAQGLSLISQTLAALRSTDGIRVVTGDVGACKDARVFRPDQVEFSGGGGTDMGAIIEHVASGKQRPDLIICVTDGYTPWPRRKSRIPTVACITSRGTQGGIPDWIYSVAI